MASSILVYSALVIDSNGTRDGCGTSPAEPAATITGSAPVSTPTPRRTVKLTANTQTVVYDRASEGVFDVFRVLPAAEVVLWYQVGSPADDSGTKGNLSWHPLVLRAGVPFMLTGDNAICNASVSAESGDSGDLPSGAIDAGLLAGRIQKIVLQNRGTSDTTAVLAKLN
jgi:hypothetical protein